MRAHKRFNCLHQNSKSFSITMLSVNYFYTYYFHNNGIYIYLRNTIHNFCVFGLLFSLEKQGNRWKQEEIAGSRNAPQKPIVYIRQNL